MDSSVILNNDEFKNINLKNTININIGVLGHIDSGKTSLARILSKITSTASLDKNPQSQERGITLDLGFSAFFTRIPLNKMEDFHKINDQAKYFQFTLVDCPGHASLIKTVIGGAQIIDLMFLVIDINKGIQTQTAECLVIGEILINRMIVILNKLDMIPENDRENIIKKKTDALRKIFGKTKYGSNVPIVPISANPENSNENINGLNIDHLINVLVENIEPPQRIQQKKKGILFMIDHCFSIKGQGTVTTGTVLQGTIKPGDEIYFPEIMLSKKIKSMQMFRRPVEVAGPGDRVATLFPGLDPSQIERTIACSSGLVQPMQNIIIDLNKINYYKNPIKSGVKYHITSGHQTVMGQLRLFMRPKNQPGFQQNSLQKEEKKDQQNIQKIFQEDQSINNDGEYVESLLDYETNKEYKSQKEIFALIELERPILASIDSVIIASKLDTDLEANICRFAFWGRVLTSCSDSALGQTIRIFRRKSKVGHIERVIDKYTVQVKDLFKKETNVNLFIGKKIRLLLTGNEGKIESSFGKSGKVKIVFNKGLDYNLKCKDGEQILSETFDEVLMADVILEFKKYLFHKNSK